MIEIKVYPQEIKDGISNVVKANSSIAYISPVVKKICDQFIEEFINKITPSLSTKARRNFDKLDLYPIQTVLVSTGWNINTDIFLKEQTWNARYSAEDKPFNLQHNQSDIIGHITDNFVVDDNYNIIPMDAAIDDVPDKFHIVTPAVIYRALEDRSKKERIEKIIAEIEAGGKWFVSMECLFADFDYGIMNNRGESRIIARNSETAGLTKFLKQYGGPGVIDGGYSIGRVLKNMLFCGKGLTDNPANPESIIFNKVQTFKTVSTNLGYIDLYCPNTNNDKGKSIMAEDNKAIANGLSPVSIEDNPAFKMVKAEKEKIEAQLAEANKKLSETNTQAFEKEIASLKDKLSNLETSLVTATKSVSELTETNKTLSAKNSALEVEIATAKKNQTRIERTSALIASGASEEEAKSIVDKFENVSAEQFTSMVELIKDKWATKAESNKEEKEEKEELKDSKAEKVLDNAKAEADAPLGVTDINKLDAVAASIAEWYKSIRNNNKKS